MAHRYYEHWTLWQYSENGRVDGSDDELVKWISPAGRILPPRPSESADTAISATKGVDVNGNGVRTRRRRRRRLTRAP